MLETMPKKLFVLGEKSGRKKEKERIAKNMLKMGIEIQVIAGVTELTLKKIEKINKKVREAVNSSQTHNNSGDNKGI